MSNGPVEPRRNLDIDLARRLKAETDELFRERMVWACLFGAVLLPLYALLDRQQVLGTDLQGELWHFVALRVFGGLLLAVIAAGLHFRKVPFSLLVLDLGSFLFVGALCTYIIARMWDLVPDYYVGLAQIMMARCVLVPGGPWRAIPVCVGLMLFLPLGLLAFSDAGFEVFARDPGRIVAAMSGLGGCLAIGLLGASFFARLMEKEVGHRQSNRYELGKQIGMGGAGRVFEARDKRLDRPCALKVVAYDTVSSDAEIRFGLEAIKTSLLSGGHVVEIYDFGSTAEGDMYFAMELLDGKDMQRMLEVGGPQPADRVIHLAGQVCAGLAEAHRRQLVHRDIKPANLMVVQRDEEPDFVKILDFGVVKVVTKGAELIPELADADDDVRTQWEQKARQLSTTTTMDDTVVGTPAYMAPEQIEGELDLDGRADIYALGGVMYSLLTGTPPYHLRSVLALYSAKLAKDPTPPSRRAPDRLVPADLEAVIMRCLQRDRERRFASVSELREALDRCADAGAWSSEEARHFWAAFPDMEASSVDISEYGRTGGGQNRAESTTPQPGVQRTRTT